MNTRDLVMASLCTVMAVTALADEARACGGCFHQEDAPMQGDEVSLVTSHVMALSISPQQTVLWDQVQFAGNPEDFAWVLPVRPGAYLEVASDAFLEALTAATSARVSPPPLACDSGSFQGCGQQARRALPPVSAFACAADEAGVEPMDSQEPDPITVVHQGSAGPYETVTLHADVPGVLTQWLQDNGYAIADDVQPIVDQYQLDGYDFIALRLAPEQGVQQMKPVRVVMPGAVTRLPLRMVAAGTGANVALTLLVIGEGRWNVQNFPSAEIDRSQLVWRFGVASSNYDALYQLARQRDGGRTWVTTYAYPGTLLSPTANPLTGTPIFYAAGGAASRTIAEAFARQGAANGETADLGCVDRFRAHADSDRVVAPACDEVDCEVPDAFIDAAELRCGELDDLALALTGMRPRDVWLTRLEADLPRAALAEDLVLEADAGQRLALHWHVAPAATDAPCPLADRAFPASRSSAWLVLLVLGGLGGAGLARRLRRHARCGV